MIGKLGLIFTTEMGFVRCDHVEIVPLRELEQLELSTSQAVSKGRHERVNRTGFFVHRMILRKALS